jgi:DNA-binding NarL/FixJ family response regulator
VTRVIIVANSGPALENLTTAVSTVPGAYIVRHLSSDSPLDRLVAPLAPDLVVMGDLVAPDHALARLAEVRRAAPTTKVVILSSKAEAGWLADALRAKASAVLPGNLEPRTLGVVLREVLAECREAPPPTSRPTQRPTRKRTSAGSTRPVRSALAPSVELRPEEEGRRSIERSGFVSARTRGGGRRAVDARSGAA